MDGEEDDEGNRVFLVRRRKSIQPPLDDSSSDDDETTDARDVFVDGYSWRALSRRVVEPVPGYEDEKTPQSAKSLSSDQERQINDTISIRKTCSAPIEVGGLRLRLDQAQQRDEQGKNDHTEVQVEWVNDPDGASQGDSSTDGEDAARRGSSAVWSVRSARTSAEVRRKTRKQRRHRGIGFDAKALRLFFNILYYAGFSLYNPMPMVHKTQHTVFRCIQKGFYWTLITISILQSIAEAKYLWIVFRETAERLDFIQFGLSLVTVLLRIQYARAFSKMYRNDENDILRQIDANLNVNKKQNCGRLYIVGVSAVVVVSIALSVFRVVFGNYRLEHWTFQDQQLAQAVDTSLTVMTWSSGITRNVTEHLVDQFGTNMTPATVALACTGNILTFLGSVHDNLMIDFWLVMAYELHQMQRQMFLPIVADEDFSPHWNTYLDVVNICEQMEQSFGSVFNLTHMENCLRLSYFLLSIYKKEPLTFIFIESFIQLLKISATYVYASAATNQNSLLKDTIIRTSDSTGSIKVDREMRNGVMLIKDIENHPLGMGRGYFHVDQGFIIKVLGCVGSVFIMLSEEK